MIKDDEIKEEVKYSNENSDNPNKIWKKLGIRSSKLKRIKLTDLYTKMNHFQN